MWLFKPQQKKPTEAKVCVQSFYITASFFHIFAGFVLAQ